MGMVLLAHFDRSWQGQWRVTGVQSQKLFTDILALACTNDPSLSTNMDTFSGDDVLSKREWQEFQKRMLSMSSQDRRDALPSAIHGIFNMDIIDEAVKSFDADKDENLDVNEFINFTDRLATLKLQAYLARAFSQSRAFFGRCQDWIEEPLDYMHGIRGDDLARAAGSSLVVSCNSSRDDGAELLEVRQWGRVQIGRDPDLWILGAEMNAQTSIVPIGWKDDFCYFSANNHAFHGLFSADPEHRLSKFERLAMEMATCGWMLFSAKLEHDRIEGSTLEGVAWPRTSRFVFVTLPGVVIWRTLFVLFTCPYCGEIDPVIATKSQIYRAWIFSRLGETLGYLVVFLGILLLVTACQGSIHLLDVCIGRLVGYIITWIFMLVVPFNPFIAVGSADPKQPQGVLNLLSIGRWRIEKQRFQALCVMAIPKVDAADHSLRLRHSIRELV